MKEKDVAKEIQVVANRMKFPVPVGDPLHQIKKMLEELERRKSTQLKFNPKREKGWRENHDRLIALRNQITAQP